MSKLIIDISSNTKITNYDVLKAYDGVYIKATEGATFISPTLDAQVQNCISRNIPFGLYHFAGKVHTAQEEYNFFKSVCAKYPQRLLPDVLDYEQTEENTNFIYDFLALDKDLIFYSYASLVNKLYTPKSKIWVAQPSANVPNSLNGYFGIQFIMDCAGGSGISNYDVSIFDDAIYSKVPITINNIEGSVKMNPIKQGENSKRVRLLQTLLNFVIGSNLQCDGVFGGATLSAVKNYQSFKKITVDGIVGINTITLLIADVKNILAN